jgi:hypothetical protein
MDGKDAGKLEPLALDAVLPTTSKLLPKKVSDCTLPVGLAKLLLKAITVPGAGALGGRRSWQPGGRQIGRADDGRSNSRFRRARGRCAAD